MDSIKTHSKTRVLNAVNHIEPDQVPFDYWGTPEYDEKLIKHFAVDDQTAVPPALETDVRYIQCMRAIYDDAAGLFKPTPPYTGKNIEIFEDGSFEDLWGVTREYITVNTGNTYPEVREEPLREMTTIREIESYKKWPRADDFDYSRLREQCKEFEGNAVILGGMPGCPTLFIQCWYLRGFEQILMDLILSPGLVHAMVNKILEFEYEYLQNVLAIIGDQIDILMLADDYGGQTGSLISLDHFRSFFRKGTQQLIDLGKKYDLKIMFHSDGNIYDFIPVFIDMGVDIVNPIQEVAPNMSPRVLKKEFGNDLCFHGGIDIQSVLPYVSADEVRNEVKNKMDILARGGGYIVSPSHMVQLDVPLQNIIEMYNVDRKL